MRPAVDFLRNPIGGMAWSRPGVFVLPLLPEHRRNFQATLFSLRREGTTVMRSSSNNVSKFCSRQSGFDFICLYRHVVIALISLCIIFRTAFWHPVLERLVISPLLHRCSVSRVMLSCLLQLALTCSYFNDILCLLT